MPLSTLYTDDFTGAAGNLPRPWVTVANPLRRNGAGQAEGTVNGKPNCAVIQTRWLDGKASVTLGATTATSNRGVAVRMDPASRKGYLFVYDAVAGRLRLYAADMTSLTSPTYSMVADLAGTCAAGDTFGVEAAGAILTMYRNGVQVGTYTDDLYATAAGHTGFGVWTDASGVSGALLDAVTVEVTDPVYADTVTVDQPWAYWPLTASGSVTRDASGNGRALTLNGASAPAAVTTGGVASDPGGVDSNGMSGSYYYLPAASNTGLGATGAVTFEAVVSADTLSSSGLPAGVLQVGGYKNELAGMRLGDTNSPYKPNSFGSKIGGVTAPSAMATGTRYLLHVRYDGATGVTDLFVNGAKVATATGTAGLFTSVAGQPIELGWNYENGRELNGLLAHAAIYDYALADARIAARWAAIDVTSGTIHATGTATVGVRLQGALRVLTRYPGAPYVPENDRHVRAVVQVRGHLSQQVPVDVPVGGLIDPRSDGVLLPGTGRPLRAMVQTHVQMPAPVLGDNGRPDQAVFQPSVTKTLDGWVRVVVGGKDVTFFRNVNTVIEDLTSDLPLGPSAARVRFPQVTPFEVRGTGALKWLREGALVEVHLVSSAGTVQSTLWEGQVVSVTDTVGDGPSGEVGVVVQCEGPLLDGDQTLVQPKLIPLARDLGRVIPETVNAVQGRAYSAMPTVTTGIETINRGDWSTRITGYVQDLLAEAVTDDGLDQWTITCQPGRRPRMILKSALNVLHTIYLGAPGVAVDLSRDTSQETTTVYGYYVTDDGCGGGNLKTPDYTPGSGTAPYPNDDAGHFMSLGDTDADTDSGNGITTLQKRLKACGYGGGVTVNGVYDSATQAAVRNAQAQMGGSVTGITAGQTWSALFAVGANSGSLDSAYYAPFATTPAVEEWLYNGDGSRRGLNPSFDPTRKRVEVFRRFADGSSKDVARAAARAEVARDGRPNRFGTITLTTGPVGTSMWAIEPGHTIRVMGYQGGHVDVGVVSVQREPHAPTPTVTLTVDTSKRDLLTLDAVMGRDRENLNPARRPRKDSTRPPRPTADCDFLGRIERHAIFGGLWSVVRCPVGVEGDVVRIDYQASNPATKFVVGFFNGPVTPAQLRRLVGNPLLERTDGYAPWATEANADDLAALGFIDAIGGPGQAAGYWPGAEDKGTKVTGRHQDGITLHFACQRPPFIYVAEWAPVSCFMEAKLRVAPSGW